MNKKSPASVAKSISFEGLEGDADAGLRSTVVLAALELGVFDVLAVDEERSPEWIADSLVIPVRRLRPLLESLAAQGYIHRGDGEGQFRADPDASSFLCSTSPSYRGHELLRSIRVLRGWSWLSEVVRRDRPRFVGTLTAKGTPTSETHLCLAARGERSGIALIEALDLSPPRQVLDLGGGTGGYAKAFLDAFESATVTLFDKPAVIEQARRRPENASYGDRLRFVEGDFLEGMPPDEYDLVLLSNVLHIFEPDRARELVRSAASRVRPKGILIVRDGMVDPGRRTPESALLFGVHMVVFSDAGRIYSTDEVASMIDAAGLRVTAIVRPDPLTEGAAVVGTKTV